MGGRAAISVALVTLALPAAALTACGGSSSGAAASSSGGESGSSGSNAPAPGFSKEAKLAAFGKESAEAERQEASQTLEENQISRAYGDFSRQCQTLAASVVEALERSGGGKSCGEVLRLEAKGMPRALLEDSFIGPVEAFRVEGNVGYALYHGTREKEYAMKMERENGEWKVVSVRNEVIR
jgi:hypothetical protein